MTAGDDDHDDDAQLRQLRQVWVSMRDEEPSDRGLASLMAAAREKASELEAEAQPSWWQRTLATLRRPPVMALATVTVLLGGALFVTQRSAKMKVEATAPVVQTTRLAEESATAPAATPTEMPPAAAPGVAASGSSAAWAGDSSGPADPAPPPASGTTRPAAPVDTRSRPQPEPSRSDNALADVTESGGEKLTSDDDRAAPMQPERGAVGGSMGGAGTATGSKTPVTRAPLANKNAASTPTADASTQAGPTIDQLVKQCETAAARNDCATVRELARRIAASSPGIYKKRVGTNVAVTRCLSVSE